jgi:hypothetical protein
VKGKDSTYLDEPERAHYELLLNVEANGMCNNKIALKE